MKSIKLKNVLFGLVLVCANSSISVASNDTKNYNNSSQSPCLAIQNMEKVSQNNVKSSQNSLLTNEDTVQNSQNKINVEQQNHDVFGKDNIANAQLYKDLHKDLSEVVRIFSEYTTLKYNLPCHLNNRTSMDFSLLDKQKNFPTQKVLDCVLDQRAEIQLEKNFNKAEKKLILDFENAESQLGKKNRSKKEKNKDICSNNKTILK